MALTYIQTYGGAIIYMPQEVRVICAFLLPHHTNTDECTRLRTGSVRWRTVLSGVIAVMPNQMVWHTHARSFVLHSLTAMFGVCRVAGSGLPTRLRRTSFKTADSTQSMRTGT